jgi:DNA-binding MarR family transcriptional regulator
MKLKLDLERHRQIKRQIKLERTMRAFEAMGFVEARKDPVTGELRYRVTEKGERTTNWAPN